MSTTVDSRVVEMRFDNKQFESGVATTISSLEKLKQKLNLDGATKGMENIDSAAKKINLSPLSNAVDTVGVRFNALWTIADQTLRNITNAAYSAGERMVKALTVEPIMTGLQEYETQINAVQTILANTESKGTTLKDVNGALDELNTYADKTIYNFTEMTRNIGTFTAAGVDLDTSVNAIQGIANLAAVSGSTSQQASTAMYQLSQAMASGTVKLMDWNSVVNAGMGGQVFQDALKETAKVHGVNVDAMIKKHGSFRETLQEGWITTDILTETLSHFTMAAEEGSKQWGEYKKSLMDQGYSEEQANAILKMSNTATDAATKVKTATQLFDTLKETAQSGWTQTWELIFGDFEEAKNLFSTLYSTLAPILENMSKARNDLLQGWADLGGRDHLIDALYNVFDAIGSVVKPIKDAFSEIFPPATAQQLFNITNAIKEFTAKLKLSDKASENLKRTFKGLFAILDIVKQIFGAVFKAISPLFGGVTDLGGGILGVTAKIGDWIVSLNESIKASGFLTTAVEKIRAAFEKVRNFLKPIIDGFTQFGSEVGDNITAVADNAEERLGPLSALGRFIMSIFTGVGKVVEKIFPFVSAAASGIGNVLSDLMGRISDTIQNADYDSMFDFLSGGIMAGIGVYIAKFFKSGSDILDNAGGFLENIKQIPENINNILGGVSDALGAFTDSIKADTLKKIATAIAILAAALLVLSLIPSEKLTTALITLTTLFGELMGTVAIFSKMGDMKGIAKTAGSLIALASAMLVLSIALKIMSTMSWSEMGVGLIAMTVGLGELVGAVWLLAKLPEKELKSSVKAIKNLASALLVLSVAMKIMSTMSWEGMGIALISMTVGLAALIGALWLLPKDAAVKTAGLIGLAAAMVVLGVALKIMATMSWEEIAKSLVALAGSLLILAGAMYLMSAAIPGALAMLIVAPALIVLAGAMKVLGSMSWEEVGRGLVALGGSLWILAIGMTAMIAAIPGALAMLLVAPALIVLAGVMKILGGMSWEDIAKGLVAIAGVFVILGAAAFVLAPLVPVILGLTGALAMLGIACLAVGAGILALGLGLTMIAAAGSAAALSLVTIISSIISLIPYLAEQIGVAIIKICEAISGGAAAICEAVAVIVVAVVDALVAAVPSLVEGLLVLIESLLASLVNHLPTIVGHLVTLTVKLLEALAAHVPELIGAVFTFLGAILNGIASNLTLLIEPVVNLWGAIFEGIAAVIGPVIQEVIAPILQVLVDLVVGLVEAIAPYIPDLTNMFTTMTTVIADAIVKVVEALAPILPSLMETINGIIAAIVTLFQEISPIIDSISGLITALGGVIEVIFNGIAYVIETVGATITDILNGIATVVEEVSNGITEALGGLEGIFDTTFNGISDVLESVGGIIETVLEGIADIIDSIGEAALNAGTGFEKLSNGIATLADVGVFKVGEILFKVADGLDEIGKASGGMTVSATALASFANSATASASGMGLLSVNAAKVASQMSLLKAALQDTVSSFASASSSMKTAGRTMMLSMISGISENTSKLVNTGKTAIKLFVTVIKTGTASAKSACTKLATTCADAITKKVSSFKSAGKDLGAGLVQGINSKKDAVYWAGYELGKNAVQGEKDGQKSASPSKLTIQAGKWLGEGLVIGMRQMGDSVYNAGHVLGETATKTISATISRISDVINSDIDAQPTIRPVIDLSGVKSGVGAISGMLDMDSSVGVRANITAINSMMNQRGQNGSNEDVVSAIDKLRSALNNSRGDTYQINGVTYDDGSNITNAVKTIVRAARIEGRV